MHIGVVERKGYMIFKHFHLQHPKHVACILSPFYAAKQNSVQSIVRNHLLNEWNQRVCVTLTL